LNSTTIALGEVTKTASVGWEFWPFILPTGGKCRLLHMAQPRQ